jgi:rod shape determining protein RodA
MNDRKSTLFNIDLVLMFSVVVLSIIGILFIYSSGVSVSGELVNREFLKQIVWAVTGLMLMFVFLLLDYSKLKSVSWIIYSINIALLIITLLFGKVLNGARSWLGLGAFGIQASEFAKLSTILFAAFLLTEHFKKRSSLSTLLILSAVVFLPMLLTLVQPDLGTAMVFIPIFIALAFLGGIPYRYIIGFISITTLTSTLLLLYAWFKIQDIHYIAYIRLFSDVKLFRIIAASLVSLAILGSMGLIFFRNRIYYWFIFIMVIILLSYVASFAAAKVFKEYQLMRLIVFLDPGIDPRGAGWNINQSITAIGSGGFLGKGFLLGPQSHNNYVPQQSTDFIFSIVAEELGFLGSALIFLAYIFILLRSIIISFKAQDEFGSLVAFGITAFFFFHFLENVGMAMGIMPVTGIPLVFLSYGGSSLWTGFISIGILLGINARRLS